jgi:methionyl-tRNA formyltransferase
MKILFIGKKNDLFVEMAIKHTIQLFGEENVKIVLSSKDDQMPSELFDWQGDYLFSYLAQWIIPQEILNNAKISCINWHPGTPDYPGIGCTNFAMYNEEKIFGITCHKMLSKVDSGEIIEVLRFNILEKDTVFSITQKCYLKIIESYIKTIELISINQKLNVSKEVWNRKPYTRKDLHSLCRLTIDLNKEEIEKRIKATTFLHPWAYIELYDHKFYLK